MNNDIHTSSKIHPSVMALLKKRCFVYIGEGVEIAEGVRIGNGVQIGKGCKIGRDSNLQANVLFSDNTIVGERCFFGGWVCTADEKYPTVGAQHRKPVVIEDDAVIGVRSTIVASNVGRKAVLGAHSITYVDIPTSEVWVGTPAKFLTTRAEYDKKKERWERMAQ